MTQPDHPHQPVDNGPAAGLDRPTFADPPLAGAHEQRRRISDDVAHIVQQTTARRLADAIADYDVALDRGAFLYELQAFDREVARAERDHARAWTIPGEIPSADRP